MIGQTNKGIHKNKLQRTLRNNMTDAERAMWRILRGRQLEGFKFRRQHPLADYILDFVCLEIKLVIEVDGGRHQEQLNRDHMRTQELTKAGFHVLRFWNNEVLQKREVVKERIWLALQELSPHPHPYPPLEGEGAKLTLAPSGDMNQ